MPNTQSASTGMSDASGNLLFYTNGFTIYDQQHQAMAGGPIGVFAIPDGALAVKQPSSSLYYILVNNNAGTAGFGYSIVDMSLASGNGSLTAVNNTIAPFNVTGFSSVIGIKHCNGTDAWAVLVECTQGNVYSYLVSSSGLNTTPTVSALTHTLNTGSLAMAASPSGNRIAISTYTQSNQPFIQIYNFNNTTGSLSLLKNLNLNGGNTLCFSPDGTKLYTSIFTSSTSTIYQTDLCAGNDSAVVASCSVVGTSSLHITAMKIAPNGKIYCATAGYGVNTVGQNSIAVIHSPNTLGAGCQFVDQGQSLGNGLSRNDLPNFVQRSYKPPTTLFNFTVGTGNSCQEVAFSALNSCTCSNSGYTPTHMAWDFGDPLSGSLNSSTLTSPIHYYSSPGTFAPKLILYYACGIIDTIVQQVTVSSCLSISSTSITCATLGTATITNLGSGVNSYTWYPSGATGSVASGLSPGTHTIQVHNSFTNISYTTTIYFAALVPLSGNIVIDNSVTCHGSSTGTGNVTNISGGSLNQYFSWTNGSVTYTSLNTPSIGVLSAGIWTTQVTDALTACQFSLVSLITQPPSMNLVLSSNSPTACVAHSIALYGINSGGTPFLIGAPYSYTWTGGPSSTSYTVSETLSGIYVYTLSSRDSLNCLVSNTVAVDFVQNPTISVASVSICPNSTGTLFATGATSYTWNGTTNGVSITDSPTITSTYTVVGIAQSCTATAVGSIFVKTSPFISLAASSPLCEGEELLLAGYGGTAYTWSGPNNFLSQVAYPQLSQVGLQNAGVYHLTITAADGCTASANGTVQINSAPAIVLPTLSVVCSSQTINLQVNSSPGASYFWTGPQSFSSNIQNPTLSNLPVGLSSYTVKATSLQNCTNLAVSSVSVVAPPPLNIQLSSNSLCAQAFNGSPNSITLTSSGANTYTLNTPLYIITTSPGGSTTPISTQPPYNSGVSTASLYGSNGVCTASLAVNITILPNPTVGVSSNTPVICAGESFTYTSFGAASYSWNPGAPGITTYSFGQVAVASPSINSVFSVIGGSLGCYSAIKTVSIDVHPIPDVSIYPYNPKVCKGKSVMLIASGTASSYYWSPSTALSSVSSPTIFASPQTSQNYSVIGTALGCTNTASTTVSVLPLPQVTLLTTKNKACLYDSIVLFGKGGLSYEWTGPNLSPRIENPLKFKSYSVYNSGTYTLVGTDGNGCKAAAQAQVTVLPLPEGTLQGDQLKGCAPFSSELYFRKITNGSDHILAQWLLNEQVVADQNKFSHSFDQPGTYVFKGLFRDTVSLCTNTQTFFIEAYPKPTADFVIEPEKPIEGIETVFFLNSSQGTGLQKYWWHFKDDPGVLNYQKNTSYFFSEAGRYPVALVVSDVNGCSDSVVKVVQVEVDFHFYVPNAFTPNDDEKNETFLPVMRGVRLYEMQIFNRWGQQIFRSENPLIGWDGRFQGEPCQQDSYIWKIKLSTLLGEEKQYSGNVVLIR